MGSIRRNVLTLVIIMNEDHLRAQRVEVDRLRSRRALIEGRLQSTLIRLQNLTSTPPEQILRLREDIVTPSFPAPRRRSTRQSRSRSACARTCGSRD